MKLIIAIITLISFQHAFAQEHTKLNHDDTSISSASAKISSAKPMCPRVTGGASCMAYGSIVKVKVTLNGCLDTLGGYFSTFKVVNGKGVLSFGALNIGNSASLRTTCYTAPVVVVSVEVPFEGKITMENLNFTGNTLPKF